MVISATVVGFILSWLLAIINLVFIISLLLIIRQYVYITKNKEKLISESYAELGSISDETFSLIKTVKSLSSEEFEIQRFSKAALRAIKKKK